MAKATPQTPADERPIKYRVLDTLEDGAGGFYYAGHILNAEQVSQDSLFLLLEAGILMFYVDPALIDALPSD